MGGRHMGGAQHGMGRGHGTRRSGELGVGVADRHGENDEQGTGSLPPWAGMGQIEWAMWVSAQARKRKYPTTNMD
jgi:hypothetical protein